MSDNTLPAWEILRQTSEPPRIESCEIPKPAMNTFLLAMGAYILDEVDTLWDPPEDGEGHSPDRLAVTIGQQMHALRSAYNGLQCESPIEELMLAALLWLDLEWASFPVICPVSFDELQLREVERKKIEFWIVPQAQIEEYRVDFMLWFQCGRATGGLIIECDGHDFHEKTKEQASRDKKRDRDLLQHGYSVMRFTGSEIHKDPIECVQEIHGPALEVLDRVSRAGGLF